MKSPRLTLTCCAGRKASTVHQYAQTEQLWAAWCADNDLSPANPEVGYVDRFFHSIKDQYSRVNLQNMLSHLRKVVDAIEASSDETATLYIRQLHDLKQYKVDAAWGGSNS